MNGRPSLGYSALSKSDTPTGRIDVLRRVAFLLVALMLVGTVFYYLTRAVQAARPTPLAMTRPSIPISSSNLRSGQTIFAKIA